MQKSSQKMQPPFIHGLNSEQRSNRCELPSVTKGISGHLRR